MRPVVETPRSDCHGDTCSGTRRDFGRPVGTQRLASAWSHESRRGRYKLGGLGRFRPHAQERERDRRSFTMKVRGSQPGGPGGSSKHSLPVRKKKASPRTFLSPTFLDQKSPPGPPGSADRSMNIDSSQWRTRTPSPPEPSRLRPNSPLVALGGPRSSL